jgi:hypothetical protein
MVQRFMNWEGHQSIGNSLFTSTVPSFNLEGLDKTMKNFTPLSL